MLTRAAKRSASQESGADHHYLIWIFGLDHCHDHCRTFSHVVTVGDQRKPVFCANFLDPIPSLAPARDFA